MPVFNGEKYLEQSLESILAQTYVDFELIISDNASTDRTQEIVESFASSDRRIRYHRNHTNLGASPNYNQVFKRADGEYFKWASHDDMLNEYYLEECVEVLDNNSKVVLCYTKSRIIDEQSAVVGESSYGLDLSSPKPQDRFREIVLSLESVPRTPIVIFGLIRSNVLDKTGLIGSFPSSDVVLAAELALYGSFYEIPKGLFDWRHHADQSVRGELASDRKRTTWFNTSFERKVTLPKWQYLIGYLKAIKNSALSSSAKLYCYAQMTRWMLLMNNTKPLVKDLLLAAPKLPIVALRKSGRS